MLICDTTMNRKYRNPQMRFHDIADLRAGVEMIASEQVQQPVPEAANWLEPFHLP